MRDHQAGKETETADQATDQCAADPIRDLLSAMNVASVEHSGLDPKTLMGKVVALSATPATGARFVGWTVNGKPAGATNPLSLTMSANLSVVATFESIR
jgi:hypothetical protein